MCCFGGKPANLSEGINIWNPHIYLGRKTMTLNDFVVSDNCLNKLCVGPVFTNRDFHFCVLNGSGFEKPNFDLSRKFAG